MLPPVCCGLSAPHSISDHLFRFLFFGGKIVTGVIDPPPPPKEFGGNGWEWELTGNGEHATIPGPFANAIPRMSKGMTTAVTGKFIL